MWEQLIKVVILSITPIVSFIIMNYLVGYKQKFSIKKALVSIFILTGINCICYNPNYNFVNTIVAYVSSIIVYKIIFDLDISKSMLTVTIMMLVILVAEFITSLILMNFDINMIRNDPAVSFLANMLSTVISIFIISFSIVHKVLIDFLEKIDKSKIYKIMIFLFLVFSILCLLIYVVFCHYHWDVEYIITIITSVVFLCLVVFFIKEQLDYSRLNREYQSFIEYVTTLEEWIEKDQLERHEYKNDLAILRTKINDKEALNFIDEKLSDRLDVDESWMSKLKNIPKGGLKGLIYYKYIVAKNSNLNISIDISKSSTRPLSKIKGNDFKDMCHILGIYIDNAIQAAEESRRKSLSIEIYVMNDMLNFVISNTYKGSINLEKLGKKGYSTKGKNHGMGLYLAKKIIKQNDKFSYKPLIINKLFVQKLIYKISSKR